MEPEQPHFIKSSMNYGLITGICLVLLSFVLYSTGSANDSLFSNIPLILLAVCIYFCTKHYRDKQLKGYISYGQGVGIGTMSGIFAAILLGFFVYLEFKLIAPELIDKQLEAIQSKMLAKGINEDEIEKATEISKKFMTPGMLFFASIFMFGLYSLIISLITSAILKKEKDPFTSDMEGILDQK